MFRIIVAFILSGLVAIPWAQAQPAPGPASGTAQAKPVVKKAATKPKTAAKAPPTDGGRCDLGVISAAGGKISLKKVGITIFGNEYSEVPFDAWGIDDLIVARVRAAAGAGIAVQRIPVGKEALFNLYEKPGKGLFNNPKENLTEAVRQIAANSHCARYIIVRKFIGQLAGTNQTLDGIGVVTHGPLGRAAVFAYTQVTVFDGETFGIHDDPFGSFGARLSASLSTKDEYLRAVEGAEFPASPEAATKDAKLRDAARTLVAERLDRILPEYLKE